MANVGMGDLAQSFLLSRQNLSLKQDMTRLSSEMTTGRVSDTALRTKGDLMPIIGLDSSLARIEGYSAITTEVGLFAGAMQTSLSAVEDMSSDLGASLLSVSLGGSALQVDAVGADAFQKLDAVIALYNTRFGDRSLFAGMSTGGPAVLDTETLMTTLGSLVASATGAQDVELAVSAWFDDPAGFSATGYLGAAGMSPFPVSAGEHVSIDVTANDPAIRDTLKGLAMAALLDRGVLSGQSAGRLDLAKRAAVSLSNSQTARVNLAGHLGLAEARIDAASVRNSNETAALQIARNIITGADPFETASKLQETQSQLEMIYSLTARMTRLSLLDYM